MGELNMTVEQLRIVHYAAGTVAGVLVFILLWRRVAGPLRRRKTAGFARRLQMTFHPRLKLSEIRPAYAYATDYPYGRPQEDATDMPHRLHIEGIADTSVLHVPRFYNVFNTSQIRNYCTGIFGGCSVEIFDWQQSRRRNDRSAKGPKSSVVAFHHPGASFPWFIAFPSIGASRRKITNHVRPGRYPEFNACYQLQAPDGLPSSENRILALFSRDALKMLVDSSTVRVSASGTHLVFSHGDVLLPTQKARELLDFGILFYRSLDHA